LYFITAKTFKNTFLNSYNCN